MATTWRLILLDSISYQFGHALHITSLCPIKYPYDLLKYAHHLVNFAFVLQALAEQLQAAVETSQVGRDVQQDQENHHRTMVISKCKDISHHISLSITSYNRKNQQLSLSIIASIIAIFDLI
jgi:hypothetical protein